MPGGRLDENCISQCMVTLNLDLPQLLSEEPSQSARQQVTGALARSQVAHTHGGVGLLSFCQREGRQTPSPYFKVHFPRERTENSFKSIYWAFGVPPLQIPSFTSLAYCGVNFILTGHCLKYSG